jgi:GntR family transcriptional regulator/MocR family aminotransferase
MAKLVAALPDIRLDVASTTPLHQQLYNSLRTAILAGRLVAGTRLPATRALAREFGISRNTVLDAYAQLLAEGYLEGKTGSGTYVNNVLPDELLQVHPKATVSPPGSQARQLSQRGTLLATTPVSISDRKSVV